MLKSIAVFGGGSWGSAIARIIGSNVQTSKKFEKQVKMYVYEEEINKEKLTDIINTRHENVKYLPGYKFPKNVLALPEARETARGADVLVFVLPHQFVRRLCLDLKDVVKPGAVALSLIKGLDQHGTGLQLISTMITQQLGTPCHVLMGANLAPEVADEKFCEATIGCSDASTGSLLKELLQTSFFRLVVVDDAPNVELCGALKNVVACGTGFIDGLEYGDNTKAAVIRLGLMEMMKFCKLFNGSAQQDTFLQSCGVADLVTTCYGGRNARLSREMVVTGKDIRELEAIMMPGQSLQGPYVAAEVNTYLKSRSLEEEFPLLTAVHKILVGELKPKDLVERLKDHPEHKSPSSPRGRL